MKHSIWEHSVSPTRFERLTSNLTTDVLIIGGGMAGVLCAYALHQAGVDYVLVETNRICSGITKCTTAKITAQHGLIYQELIRRFGVEQAGQYYRANEEALQQYRALCQSIDCDYETKDAYVYSRNNKKQLEQEVVALEKLGGSATLVDTLPLPFPIAGAVKLANQAQFHPLKLVAAIASGLHIYEQTNVRELVGKQAITENGTITANSIIVTTHFPFLNQHGSYFLKLYQRRSYVIALANAPDVNGIIVDAAQGGMSFRNFRNMLLVGGGDHRTGKHTNGWQGLRRFAAQYYRDSTEQYHWATQDCMSLDGVPYIGQYSSRTKGLYVATGFNQWGMSSSMVAARMLCDMVQGHASPYERVFSPSRSMMRPQLAVNAWEAMASFVKPTTKRCPHLGCALRWNAVEKTWDCPCHGSRFTQDGTRIDNPATGNCHGKL